MYRPREEELSPTGLGYGPVDLPAALVPPGAEIGPEEGKLAPDFVLEEMDGGEVRLSDLRGKAVVINFWATWCKPCRKEVPQLIDAYNAYRDQGLVVLGLNLQESASIIRPFVDDFGMNFPIPLDRKGDVADRYRLLGLPTTYFVDRQGVVRCVFTGPFVEKVQGTSVQAAIEENDLLKRIEEILG
ncbi:MAG: redoxin domain-containing protein [Chloroflexi bacterium]|nr:redoxin domain-containing protein [Chloroflexota bacterium]